MNEFGIDLDTAVNELAYVVEEAHNFMTSEFNEDWETAEAYYAGKSSVPVSEGRSSLVKTEVRDVIRSLMPNVMRTLLHARKPVVYTPNSIMTAALAEQQSLWATQLFNRCGGYRTLLDAVQEGMKLKVGPVKTYWIEDPHPEHFMVSGITAAEVLEYQEQPDVIVDEVVEREHPTGGDITYDIRATRYFENGKIEVEAFPVYEFFCERRATSDLENYVHGHRRTVKVGEALEMGLEYDNWRELDNDNPAENDAVSNEQQRRGYMPNQDENAEADLINYEFLLSEVYCKYDMDGDGVPEKYVFYLGGTSYTYLHHEKIEDFCIDLVCLDPVSFTAIGRSVVDITKDSQDTETALLRAIVDNALIANNPRPAADPTRTNFNDLMNNAIGAPIRTKGKPDIQYADIPFTAQGLIPLLQYLEQDAQTRVGVTKAAYGLDPDAMQSTDKEAVRNTIQLSQGQVEFMVRNLVETALIPLFRRLLRLSMRHMDRLQMVRDRGAMVPVDISRFDPYLVAEPNVGLGTASPDQKLGTLQFIYAEQKQFMMQFGMDNPFTSMSQMYNTLEDMVELGGIVNTGRYFNHIDKAMERVIGENMARDAAAREEQARQDQPMDPGRSLMMVESMKSRQHMIEVMSKQRVEELKLQQRSLQAAEENDIARDKMLQERVIKLAEIGQGAENERIRQEQASNNPQRSSGSAGTAASGSQ